MDRVRCIVGVVLRALLGATLLLAAIGKLSDGGRDFMLLLRNLTPIDADFLIHLLVWSLPRLEIILAALLLLGSSLRLAAMATTALFAVFTFWMAWIVLSGAEPPSCGCFAIRLLDEAPPVFWLIRNLGCTALALAFALNRSDCLSLDRILTSRSQSTQNLPS